MVGTLEVEPRQILPNRGYNGGYIARRVDGRYCVLQSSVGGQCILTKEHD